MPAPSASLQQSVSLQVSTHITPNNASPPENAALTNAKNLDVYAIVPAAVNRKSTKNTWDSKYIAANRPRLTEDEILQWADAYFERTGEWPKAKTSGTIPESPESNWGNISMALRKGLRGLMGDSSLPLLLWQRRGVRNHLVVPLFSVEEILIWADAFYARSGQWPTAKSGPVAEAPEESWQIVSTALRVGTRSLPGGISLAKLLSAQRGVRVLSDLPRLTEDLILEWADAHFRCTRTWPGVYTGAVGASPSETWSCLNAALINGGRGLPGGTSLVQLMVARRGIRASHHEPRLSVAQILEWADAHRARRGCWPVTAPRGSSAAERNVPEAPGETWGAVNAALLDGTRGLPGGSSLSQLLSRERGYRRTGGRTLLTEGMILGWADAHFARVGKWPVVTYKSDEILNVVADAPRENWAGINTALRTGGRGLPGGVSLAQFLLKHRGRTPGCARPPLSTEQILGWARAHYAQTGRWPTAQGCGTAPGTDEPWAGIHTALQRGTRGLPGGDSLTGLLARECGYRNSKSLAPLTEAKILAWADAHFARVGIWPVANPKPSCRSEKSIPEAPGENWAIINGTLRAGGRSLPGGSSLAQFLAKHRGKQIPTIRTTPLSVEQILVWAQAYTQRTGKWPGKSSGFVEGTEEETWSAIGTAIELGCRGLPGGDTLTQLLMREWGQSNPYHRAPLTEAQILAWADAFHARTGKWPGKYSGSGSSENLIPEAPDESWSIINSALSLGSRGLPGGSSLTRFLAQHRNKHLPVRRTTPLSIAQILAWARSYQERTGRWPNKNTGTSDGMNGETWSAISTALSKGGRGMPGGTTLSQILETHLGKPAPVCTMPLHPEDILAWARTHRACTGQWPSKASGAVEGRAGEVWSSINMALRHGQRGLPGGINLPQFIRQKNQTEE